MKQSSNNKTPNNKTPKKKTPKKKTSRKQASKKKTSSKSDQIRHDAMKRNEIIRLKNLYNEVDDTRLKTEQKWIRVSISFSFPSDQVFLHADSINLYSLDEIFFFFFF